MQKLGRPGLVENGVESDGRLEGAVAKDLVRVPES